MAPRGLLLWVIAYEKNKYKNQSVGTIQRLSGSKKDGTSKKKLPLQSNLEKQILSFASCYDGNIPAMICKSMLFRSKKLVAFKNYNFKYIYCKIPLCNAMGYKANSVRYVESATS